MKVERKESESSWKKKGRKIGWTEGSREHQKLDRREE